MKHDDRGLKELDTGMHEEELVGSCQIYEEFWPEMMLNTETKGNRKSSGQLANPLTGWPLFRKK